MYRKLLPERDSTRRGTVYLLHFDRPFKHAQHYYGFAVDDLARRLGQHGTGEGARLLYHVAQAGITWRVARVWEGMTLCDEYRLKNRGGGRRMCPICNERLAIPTLVSGAPNSGSV